jgi:predicted O-methyltransferase YrrM
VSTFAQWRAERLEELIAEQRVVGNDALPPASLNSVVNHVPGLIELVRMTRPTAVVEVGCHRGVSTEVWLLHAGRVVAVDCWGEEAFYREFMARVGDFPNLGVVRDRSLNAAPRFHEGEFDLVYIDADHSYAAVEADIRAWAPKVRPGGWITGHDYCELTDDVRRAVDQCFGKPMAVFADTSWAVRTPTLYGGS